MSKKLNYAVGAVVNAVIAIALFQCHAAKPSDFIFAAAVMSLFAAMWLNIYYHFTKE